MKSEDRIVDKPKVIIADTDLEYIISLQLKFVKEYFNKIDLEIITDSEYFRKLFLTPQSADILIISEDLYTTDIQKHSISNIFVMMEKYEDGSTGELNINQIFKYSSIKEIFNEIAGKSGGVLNSNKNIVMDTQIILVTSAYGGAGKTTVSMGIASCLAKNHKKVLYLNASKMQMFQYYLENKTPLSSHEIHSKLINPSDDLYGDIKHFIRLENFYYIPAFKTSLMSIGISFSIFRKIALSAKRSKEYDFIIIDVDTGLDEEIAKLYDVADKVVVVSEQSSNAIFTTNNLLSNLNGVTPERYIFVCNKFNPEKYNAIISPGATVKFSINEYVEEIQSNGVITGEELSEISGIKKAAFLLV